MLIDTHAHLNFNAYKKDAEEVIRRSLDADIWMINIGTQYDTSKKAIEIAEKYEKGVYAAIGLHPIHLAESRRRVLDEGFTPHRRETGLVKIKNDTEEIEIKTREEEFDYEKYKSLAKSKKIVAIGEFGLDYYWRPKTTKKKEIFKQKQKEAFLQQLKLAKELNLPVILHCRVAHDDLISFLQNPNNNAMAQNVGIKGVMHGFVGTTEQLQKYLDMGLYIGFNGIIFKNIEGINFEENIRKTPLDKILIETDCPYLTPPQEQGRNEPLFVKYVAEKIAKIKNIRAKRTLFSSSPSFLLRKNSVYEEISRITTENAQKLFKNRAS